MSPITFGLDGSFDIDLGGGYALDNTDSDINEYGFGQPSPYGNKGMISSSFEARAADLREQAERAESNSLRMLEDAMKKSAYVTPEQGIASAILAAIPTLGGYMIGKSVGTPDLPAGYFEAGGKRSDIPGYDQAMIPEFAAGLSGTKVGLGSADSYLKGLEADQAQANDVKQKMAGIYTNQATKLDAQAAQLENAALNKQAEIDMIPIREASQMRLQENQGRITADRQFELQSRNADRERIPASILAKIERGEPVTEAEFAGLQPEAIRAITNLKEANRRQVGQDWKHDQAEGNRMIPGASLLPGAAPDPKSTFTARTAISNYNELNRVHMPELRRVFTDPNVSTDEQAAALAGAVVAIKNQQKMGANFTALEESLVKAGLPRIAEISTGSLANFFKAELQGQDAMGKLNRLQRIIDLSVEAQINPFGYTLSNTSGASASYGSTSHQNSNTEMTPPTTPRSQQTGTPQGSMPQRSQFKTPQEYLNALRQYNNS